MFPHSPSSHPGRQLGTICFWRYCSSGIVPGSTEGGYMTVNMALGAVAALSWISASGKVTHAIVWLASGCCCRHSRDSFGVLAVSFARQSRFMIRVGPHISISHHVSSTTPDFTGRSRGLEPPANPPFNNLYKRKCRGQSLTRRSLFWNRHHNLNSHGPQTTARPAFYYFIILPRSLLVLHGKADTGVAKA